jgi:hypothetical protein
MADTTEDIIVLLNTAQNYSIFFLLVSHTCRRKHPECKQPNPKKINKNFANNRSEILLWILNFYSSVNRVWNFCSAVIGKNALAITTIFACCISNKIYGRRRIPDGLVQISWLHETIILFIYENSSPKVVQQG